VAIRTVIAEDNLLVREGVRSLLSDAEDVDLVGTFEDLPGVEAGIEALHPDVVITDIRMPPGGRDEGLRLAARLRVDRPEIGVVVLSQYAEPEYVLALLEDGAQGRAYLLKERLFDAGELVRAVTAVAGSGSVIDPKVVEVLVHARRTKQDSQLAQLTTREREVLEQIAQGSSNAAAARELSMSERAVEKHISVIFSKLGLLEERDVNRRVKATLLYLAGGDSAY
jgi:DNA-binding NarL/FixJ family response regulator